MNKTKIIAVGKTSALVGVAAAGTYFLANVTGQELGEYGPVIVVVLTGLLKFVQTMIPTTTKEGNK